MEVPLLLQFSIALFTGMVAATFVPPVRRSIPTPVEVLLWVGFLTVCVLGVASITDPNARELSASAAWGADQIINTMVGLTLGGLGGWILDHRFPIASWLVIVAGADIFGLMFLRSMRSAGPWRPRIRLREWMELPVPEPAAVVARRRLIPADPLADVNRRLVAAGAIAGTAVLAWLIDLSIWVRDVMVPREARRLAQAAATGKVESHARLEGLRDATAHLQYAARSWYAAAGEPAINGLAAKAGSAARTARAARPGLSPTALRPDQVIDIHALMSAQSLGWYGPLNTAPNESPGEQDDAESQRPDRLAS
ncbi:MAG: hypothetical protein E6J06_05065 [Chloroflexi bacterium]|nr:MAG: hypothetical protein E6J06_05065 [Chloroflexota bacterium]